MGALREESMPRYHVLGSVWDLKQAPLRTLLRSLSPVPDFDLPPENPTRACQRSTLFSTNALKFATCGPWYLSERQLYLLRCNCHGDASPGVL